jgi:hypothetical protein
MDTIEFLAKPRFKDKAFLQQKYLVEKLSMAQIAALCFSSRPTISRHLKRYGISVRKGDQRLLLNKGQLALGEKRWKGAIHANQEELKVVRKIMQLREQGYSYRQIAAWLDGRGIRTKNRRSQWKAATVMKICRRATESALV